MAWLNSLSIRSKLIAGCYLIATLFSATFIVTVIVSGGSIGMAAIFIVILLAVTLPISRVIERALTSAIDDITSVAFSISKGDFSSRVDVSGTNAGELGHSFNSMIDKLREILNETTGITRHVSDASRSIFDKNSALKTVMEQVAISSGELASGANAISEDVSGMTESIQEIEHMVADYASSTKEMNMRSEHTLELVEKGRQAVETQSEGMRRNVEATAAVSSTIEELARNAEGISKITRSISDIAEQTNLLSLNASIEAARAGEHGKGFAVVAQEVRKLAEESTTSTQEVFGLVRSIDVGVKQAIATIQINEEVVRKQSDLIHESEKVFDEIVQSVRFISEQIFNFSRESDTMLESAKKISASIQNISAITQQSAAGTEQVSASMNEQISSVQAVVEETENMQQMVMRLQKTIHIFKF
jgi:methyl-accepting chemotaxis protein